MNEKIIETDDDDKFSILINIDTINNYNELILESLNVKIYKKFKQNIYFKQNGKIPQDENEQETSSREIYKIYCVVVAGLIALLILIIFILRRFFRERPRQRNIFNQIINININVENQNKEIEDKKKI